MPLAPLQRTAYNRTFVLTCLVIVPVYFSYMKFHSIKQVIYFSTGYHQDFNSEAKMTCSLGEGGGGT